VYDENFDSSNITNTMTSSSFDSFIKENESDLAKYFSTKQPARYGKFSQEGIEERNE